MTIMQNSHVAVGLPVDLSLNDRKGVGIPMRILLVDDDAITQEVLAHGLKEAGYDVVTAVDGEKAMALQRESPCPIIISDWMMPEVNGLDLCQWIRLDDVKNSHYSYFILLTARAGREDRMTALNAGVDDFLTKPVDEAELRARLRNAQRILSLETRDVAIFALAKLADSRDPETGAHLERIRGYCGILADHLNKIGPYQSEVNEEFVRLIYRTSPLHDIGKVGIPDRILLKPGRLNNDEFEAMKEHTLIGAKTLGELAKKFPTASFLEMAYEIALTHHERWNGSGYPNGISGLDIPLAGRIVALADVYDALISKRVYKAAFSHGIARDMIVEDSGSHFDPSIVDAFVATEQAFVEVYNSYHDAET